MSMKKRTQAIALTSVLGIGFVVAICGASAKAESVASGLQAASAPAPLFLHPEISVTETAQMLPDLATGTSRRVNPVQAFDESSADEDAFYTRNFQLAQVLNGIAPSAGDVTGEALSGLPEDEEGVIPVEERNVQRPVMPLEETGESASSDVPKTGETKGPDVYYDSAAMLPPEETLPEPRKADPRTEPAQKYVIVDIESGTDSMEAGIAAANRALALGRPETALSMFEDLYNRNKKDQRVLMGLGVANQKLGRIGDALDAYQGLLDLNPGATDALINMMGLIAKHDPAQALRELLDLRKSYPNHPRLAAQTGLTHAALGNLMEARRYLGIAMSLDAFDPRNAYNMAVISDRLGDRKEAIKYYEQALDLARSSGESEVLPRNQIYERLSRLRNG